MMFVLIPKIMNKSSCSHLCHYHFDVSMIFAWEATTNIQEIEMISHSFSEIEEFSRCYNGPLETQRIHASTSNVEAYSNHLQISWMEKIAIGFKMTQMKRTEQKTVTYIENIHPGPRFWPIRWEQELRCQCHNRISFQVDGTKLWLHILCAEPIYEWRKNYHV